MQNAIIYHFSAVNITPNFDIYCDWIVKMELKLTYNKPLQNHFLN